MIDEESSDFTTSLFRKKISPEFTSGKYYLPEHISTYLFLLLPFLCVLKFYNIM